MPTMVPAYFDRDNSERVLIHGLVELSEPIHQIVSLNPCLNSAHQRPLANPAEADGVQAAL